MNCEIKNREKTIDDYLTGLMTEAEKEAFDEHCFECETCFQELSFKEEAIRIINKEGDSIFKKYLSYQGFKTRVLHLGEKIKLYLFPSKKLPAFAYAAITLFVFIIGFQSILKTFDSTTDYPINFDQTVPSGFGQTGLRSESDAFQKGALFSLFNNQYLLGIGDYLICDYASAIKSWQKIETIAADLESGTSDAEFSKTIANYYFYYGVSNLASSVTKKQRLNEMARKKYRTEAIRFLTKAESLMNRYHFEDDKIIFYLGTTFGIDGNKSEAIFKLKQISENSDYYYQANDFINKWAVTKD